MMVSFMVAFSKKTQRVGVSFSHRQKVTEVTPRGNCKPCTSVRKDFKSYSN